MNKSVRFKFNTDYTVGNEKDTVNNSEFDFDFGFIVL